MPSTPPPSLEHVRDALLSDPQRAAVLVDFDGTLAPIVDEPAAATADSAVVDALDALVGRLGRVAVVSGRPLSFLLDRLGPRVDLSGLYGLESRLDGVVASHPDVDPFRPRIAEAASAAAAHFRDPGVVVESKGLSLTIHFRQAPLLGDGVHEWASSYASDHFLELRPAKASVELHPPVAVDKGTVSVSLAEGCRVVTYIGDDIGDLPAFAALDQLRESGVTTWKVAVRSPELPHVIERASDLVVDGPGAVAELLTTVAASL